MTRAMRILLLFALLHLAIAGEFLSKRPERRLGHKKPPKTPEDNPYKDAYQPVPFLPPAAPVQPAQYQSREVVSTIDVTYVCPEGYSPGDTPDECCKTEVKKARVGCRPGYVMTGGQCVSTETSEPDYVCDVGFSAQGDKCVLLKTAAKELSCPRQYTIRGDKCGKDVVSNVLKSCADGFTLDGDACVAPDQQPAMIQCEADGYELQADQQTCIRSTTAPGKATCPPGYVLQDDTLCAREVRQPAELQCPAGSQLTESAMCETIDVQNAAASCGTEPGFVQTGSVCHRERTASPTMECPTGYVLTSEVFPVKGWDSDCQKCVQTISAPALVAPPADAKEIPADGKTGPVHLCREGSVADGENCVTHKIVGTIAKCPPGFRFVKDGKKKGSGVCRSSDSVDVSYSCPDGYDLRAQGTPALVTMGDHHKDPAVPAIPTVMTCVRRRVVPAKPTCPAGHDLDQEAAECSVQETKPADTACPTGFTLDAAAACRKTEQMPSAAVCPGGYTLEQPPVQPAVEVEVTTESEGHGCKDKSTACTVQVAPPQPAPLCMGQKLQPPKLRCPARFTLVQPADANSRTPPQCKGVIEAAPIAVCPREYVPDEATGQCTLQEISAPTPVCPKGYDLKFEATCQVTVKTEPGLLCPASFKLEGVDKCTRWVSTRVSPYCPEPYKFDAKLSKCAKTDIQTVVPQQQEVAGEPQEQTQVAGEPQEPPVVQQTIIQTAPQAPRTVYVGVPQPYPVVIQNQPQQKKGCVDCDERPYPQVSYVAAQPAAAGVGGTAAVAAISANGHH